MDIRLGIPLFVFLLSQMCTVRADMPTNCSYEETVGEWVLYLGSTNHSNNVDCNEPVEVIRKVEITLLFPNKVVDGDGNVGTWTMVYNQGFALELHGRKYFAYQWWDNVGTRSICNKTFNGWVHDRVRDNVYPPQNWGCYYALKSEVAEKSAEKLTTHSPDSTNPRAKPSLNSANEFVEAINQGGAGWRAAVYPESMRLQQFRRGRVTHTSHPRVRPSQPSPEAEEQAMQLPENFDWRTISAESYVSPVRNQGACGSCYAFGSMGMLEARMRIRTNNTHQPVYSTQNIVSCSNYSQGCYGGFPYLVAGKYGEDFGVIEEKCYPYKGEDSKCHPTVPGCPRQYVQDYGYVGDFYGGCNEPLMKVELWKYGPIAVSFEIHEDFMQYRSGIYHHTGLGYKYDPFELTNHCVLVVGWGEEKGVKYWTVKNSWGEEWGEEGYFRIVRGNDECAIESLAVWANLYLP